MLLLTCQEVAEITGRCKWRAQQRVLQAMGIPHRVRPDGSIVVLRADIAHSPLVAQNDPEPDWSQVR